MNCKTHSFENVLTRHFRGNAENLRDIYKNVSLDRELVCFRKTVTFISISQGMGWLFFSSVDKEVQVCLFSCSIGSNALKVLVKSTNCSNIFICAKIHSSSAITSDTKAQAFASHHFQ